METNTTVVGAQALDNLEICEQALNTTRKRKQFIKGLAVASAGIAAAGAPRGGGRRRPPSPRRPWLRGAKQQSRPATSLSSTSR